MSVVDFVSNLEAEGIELVQELSRMIDRIRIVAFMCFCFFVAQYS